MPPAFNLSQDQTLQFKPVTVFGLSRTRSLTQRTDEVFNHLPMEKPSFHYCVRLLILLLWPDSEESGPRSASSAHTYRLLVFKDRSAHCAVPDYPAPLRLRRCVCSREARLWRAVCVPSIPFSQFIFGAETFLPAAFPPTPQGVDPGRIGNRQK